MISRYAAQGSKDGSDSLRQEPGLHFRKTVLNRYGVQAPRTG